MILNIRVTPKASRNLVKQENGNLRVYVTRPAEDGLANAHVIELLAEHFHLKKYEISIIKGEKSRNKSVQVPDYAKH
jgi:hypothetical protein